MGNILTKADVQAYAPELDLSKFTDVTISGMLSRAQAKAAAFASVTGFDKQAVINETDRAYIDNEGNLQISVRRHPIVTMSGIALVKGGFSTNLVLNDPNTGQAYYQEEYPGNKITFPNSYFYMTGTYLAGGASQLLTLRGAKVMYQATYVGGFDTPPEDLKEAIMLYFRDAFTKQFNPQGLSSFTQGSYSESYAGSNANKGVSPLIAEAQAILRAGNYCRLEF